MENENNEMEYQTVLENIAEKTKSYDDSRDVKNMAEGYKAFSDADSLAMKNERELEQREEELKLRRRELEIREAENEQHKVEWENEATLKKEELRVKEMDIDARIKIAKTQARGSVTSSVLNFLGAVMTGFVAPMLYAKAIHDWEIGGDYIHNDKNKRPPRFK